MIGLGGRRASSLYLEAVAFPDAFRATPPTFDVLVVAGDVSEGDTDGALRTVRRLANGKPAVFVLGNHEFWGREIRQERRAARRTAERREVVLLDDGVADLADLRFVGGTLWADGGLAGAAAAPDQPTGERIVVGPGARPITGAHGAPSRVRLPRTGRRWWSSHTTRRIPSACRKRIEPGGRRGTPRPTSAH